MIRSVVNTINTINNTNTKSVKSNYLFDTIKTGDTLEENLLLYMGISKERLSFYESNKRNANKLLDAINFYSGAVSADDNTTVNGFFSFGSDGHGQVIPMSSVPRINSDALDKLYAAGNTLSLSSNTYYSYKATDGNSYACAFNGRVISRAFSEAILGDDRNNVSATCRGNTTTTMSIVSSLARGSIGDLHMLKRSSVKEKLGNVGIEPGEFKLAVDGETKTYYLGENGEVYTQKRAQEIVEMYNSNTWLKNRNVGDKIMVFGKEYAIDETGHINVLTEGFWENEKCNYGTFAQS